VEWWPCRWAHSHYSPTRPARYMCYAWGEGGSAAQAPFLKNNFFHFRALLTEKMKKEHAHISGGGCNKLATCLLSSSFCLENVQLPYFFSELRLHARTTHVLSFLHVQRPGPLLAVHTPQPMLAPRRHTFFLSFASHSLHPLSSHVYRMAPRHSLRPRATVTPPPWSSSWRQARTRTRRTR
jgi:hypothetical protein